VDFRGFKIKIGKQGEITGFIYQREMTLKMPIKTDGSRLFTLLLSASLMTAVAAQSFGYGYTRRGYAYGTFVCPCPPGPVYYEKGEPIPLFNGIDLTGWTDAEGGAPNPGWTVQDGALCRCGEGAGNLFTTGAFDNFILEFDFKTATGANGGLKYRLWNQAGDILGCEYQILDPEAGDSGALHLTASLYDVFPAEGVNEIFKRGDYNHGKIVIKGNHIEHWLNNRLIVSVLVDSCEWRANVAKSKFADSPCFGRNTRTRFFLQDHGDTVWFKNIVLTPLKPLQ
jgi:hypothetical protein